MTVAARLDALATEDHTDPDPLRGAAERFLALRRARFSDPDGPLWDRALADGNEAVMADAVAGIVAALEVDRVVVGHTTTDGHRIVSRFGGRVLVIDTAAGPAYGGRASALEIAGGRARALYRGESEVLEERPAREAEATLP